METKLFEVLDRMTFVPVICIKLTPADEEERYLCAMAGYGIQAKTIEGNILYAKLSGGEMTADPFEKEAGGRTHSVAHQFIEQSWDELKSGDVIDVEFILMESKEKKISQRLQGC